MTYGRPSLERMQAAEFYRQRATILKNWPEVRAVLGLGAEHKLVEMFVQRCTPSHPWAWVQIGTQAEWAASWGLSERTFKRHLRLLVDRGVLIGEVTSVTRGVRSPTLKQSFKFPVYRVNPALIEAATGWPQPVDNSRDNLWNKLALKAGGASISPKFKCQFGTYPSSCEQAEGQYCKSFCRYRKVPTQPATTGIEGVGESPLDNEISKLALNDIDKENRSTDNQEESSNRVRQRLRRRRTDRGDEVVPRWIEDDDPEPIGADPDRPPAQDRRRPATITPVLDAFERSWQAARRDRPQLPPRISSTRRSLDACRGWLKATFLAEHCGGDVELAVAVVELFCEQVAAGAPGWEYRPNPERGVWDPWQHLSPRAEATRQLLLSRGWRPATERDLAVQQAEERKRDVERLRSLQRSRREQEQARETPPAFVKFRPDGTPEQAQYGWLLDEQSVDYRDWRDVP